MNVLSESLCIVGYTTLVMFNLGTWSCYSSWVSKSVANLVAMFIQLCILSWLLY